MWRLCRPFYIALLFATLPLEFFSIHVRMRKRIMGVETEYGAALRFFTGMFSHGNPSEDILRHFERERAGEFLALLPFNTADLCFWFGTNGAKLYKDGEHMEYSSPECRTARDVALYDKVGDAILAHIVNSYERAEHFRKRFQKNTRAYVTKNNSDFMRETGDPGRDVHMFGSHENYLAETRFFDFTGNNLSSVLLFRHRIAPFLASRVILHGAGGMVYQPITGWTYALSQRALAIERMVGCGTTGDRPLIPLTLRDCSQLGGGVGRFHLICGDSNMSPWSVYLRFGATHLVLRALEELKVSTTIPDLVDPLRAFKQFALDPGLCERAEITHGISYTALEIQALYLEIVSRLTMSEEERAVFEYWQSVVSRLRQDPEELSGELDWVIKLYALKASMKKRRYTFRDERARMFDLLYSYVGESGIYSRLERAGGVKKFFEAGEVERAMHASPKNTRAHLRAFFLRNLYERRKGHDDPFRLLPWDFDWSWLVGDLAIADPFACDPDRIRRYFKKLK